MVGLISSIQHFSLGDGTGIRSTVFMQGCNLHCSWCHNPETIPQKPVLLYNPHLCIGCGQCAKACPENAHGFHGSKHVFNQALCTTAGECARACPSGSLKISGKYMEAQEVLAIILEDKDFYTASGGGITISGGEPLLQPEFVSVIAKECAKNNIHVIVDTAASLGFASFQKVMPYVGTFYVDIKSGSREAYRDEIGGSLCVVLDNMARLIKEGCDLVARIPLIPGFNDDKEQGYEIARLLKDARVTQVHILPFHRMGSGKYAATGREYLWGDTLPPPKKAVEEYMQIFIDQGFICEMGG